MAQPFLAVLFAAPTSNEIECRDGALGKLGEMRYKAGTVQGECARTEGGDGGD